MQELPPAILLMGPTASGKTELAMRLCERLPVELVSVDSALIYRGMDIGTAKPSVQELARFPHRLIDICDPAERYSAERFRRDALAAMQEITRDGRIPLLVGGTMLYYRALQYGLSPLPAADSGVRVELERRLRQEGLESLHAQLAEIDPEAAKRIHPNDPQRTLRALEVWMISGRPLSELQAQSGQAMPFRAIKLARAPEDRVELHRRIEVRFEQMLEQGFEQEVMELVARGDLDPDMPSMRSVGYRQVWEHLRGECDRPEMVERGKAATRQLAKRQITWLRSEEHLNWVGDDLDKALKNSLKLLESVPV